MAINTKPYIYFSVWLLFSLVISACDKAGDRFAKNRIKENERVEFKILNTEFDIPIKYVKGDHGQELIYLKRPAYGPYYRILKAMMRVSIITILLRSIIKGGV